MLQRQYFRLATDGVDGFKRTLYQYYHSICGEIIGHFLKLFSNFLQVIEHYKSQGEPASLMATTSGAGRIGEKKNPF